MRNLFFSRLAIPVVFALAGCSDIHMTGGGLLQILISPPGSTLFLTQSAQLSVSTTGSLPPTVTWSVNGTRGGNTTFGLITANGLFTAPAALPLNPNVTITATSSVDSTISTTTTLLLKAPQVTSVTVSCNSASILKTTTATCSASVGGFGPINPNVTWSATNGTITPQGIFTPTAAGVAVITATSIQNPGQSGTASIIAIEPIMINSVTVNCTPASILITQISNCSATVLGTGAFDPKVAWYVNGVAGGNDSLGHISPLAACG